jgi:hypothetical protein
MCTTNLYWVRQESNLVLSGERPAITSLRPEPLIFYFFLKIWPLEIIFSYFSLLPSNNQRSAPVNHKKILSFQKSFTFPLRICRRYHCEYWQFCRTIFERIALGCWKVQGTNHDPGGQERLNVFYNVSRSPWSQWTWSYSQLHPPPIVYLYASGT